MDRPCVLEAPPGPDLVGLCRCTYVALFDGGRYDLVPDGCVDLLWRSDGTLVVCGPETTGWSFRVPVGSTTAGVRLEPGVAPAMLRTSADELRDRQITIDAIVPAPTARRLVDRLGHAANVDGQRRVLVDLARRLADGLDERGPSLVPSALASDPHGDVASVARELGLSRRQLHRAARRALGYGPSMFRRVTRVQRALQLLDAHGEATLASVAAEAGFADQPHMTREFRAIARMTPAQAALRRSHGGSRPATMSVAAQTRSVARSVP